jgi:hypothetical protein
MRFSCCGRTGAADIAVSIHFVDVFGAEPNQGDPLAVIAGADALSTEAMQRGTRWLSAKGRDVLGSIASEISLTISDG